MQHITQTRSNEYTITASGNLLDKVADEIEDCIDLTDGRSGVFIMYGRSQYPINNEGEKIAFAMGMRLAHRMGQ